MRGASDCRKRTHRKVNTRKLSSLVRNIVIITNELFHLCSFCHKCQKPVFYTLCLLRHRSLPYLCTACFALPRLRPFSFVSSACRLYRHADAPLEWEVHFWIYFLADNSFSLGLFTMSEFRIYVGTTFSITDFMVSTSFLSAASFNISRLGFKSSIVIS